MENGGPLWVVRGDVDRLDGTKVGGFGWLWVVEGRRA